MALSDRQFAAAHDRLLELRQQLDNLNQPVVLSEWQQLQKENEGLRQQLAFATQERNGYREAQDLACEQRDELRQQVTLLREPLLYIDEVAKTSKTIISVAAAAMKMLKKIRAALAATEQGK